MKAKFSRIDAACEQIEHETRTISDILYESEYFKTNESEWEKIEDALRSINSNARAMKTDGNDFKDRYIELKSAIVKALS